MPFPHEVYKTQRIVPIRFARAGVGFPIINFPDIDDRGWFRNAPTGNNAATNDHGFVVGVTQGDTVFIQLTREKVEDTSPLFVTSSNTATMTCGMAGTGADALLNIHDINIQVTGVAGGAAADPNIARVQVRHGSNTGPIIGELSVWVFRVLNVNLVPHNVTIAGAGGGAGIGSAVNITAVTDMVKAIWRPCGVDFTVAAVQNHNLNFATAGVAAWQGEVNTILGTGFVAGSINAYFVNQIQMAGFPGVLGVGISRPNQVAFGTPNPGIILGDTNASGSARAGDTHWLANDLAHEIGHFFTLEHPDKRSPPPNTNTRFDTWAVRMLMHNFNLRAARTDWRNDVTYGPQRRGCLITMKDLVDSGNAVHHSTDNECRTARAAAIVPGNF